MLLYTCWVDIVCWCGSSIRWWWFGWYVVNVFVRVPYCYIIHLCVVVIIGSIISFTHCMVQLFINFNSIGGWLLLEWLFNLSGFIS